MKKVFIGLLLIVAVNNLHAQTEVLKDNGSWFTLTNNFKLSEKFYVLNVVQQRRVKFLKETQAFLYAPSINYKLTKNISIGAGYMHYTYYPNGVSHSSIHKDENRYFQQLSISSQVGKVKFSNRFMFEERVIETVNTNITPNIIDGDKYSNRFRYRIQVSTNLFKLSNNKYLLGKLSNEIRIRFSDGITEPDFDQNNFEALLGYKLLDNSTIWMGYGRYYFRKNSKLYISNNILHVTASYNFDFTKKK